MREGLGRTLPSESFAQATASPPAPAPTIPVDEQRFSLHAAALTHRLSDRGAVARSCLDGEGERFEVLQVIGDGANGRVYAVRDRDLDRDVAVKFLKTPAPIP